MSNSILIPPADTPIFSQLGSQVRHDLTTTLEILRRIDASGNKRQATLEEERRMGGKYGYDYKSLTRKYYAWLHSGRNKFVLINKSKLKRRTEVDPISHVYKTYAENNQRGSREAWRQMILDLCAGKDMPGIGTWVMVWAKENPHKPIPAKCPYSINNPPAGMTYGNLQNKYKLSKFEKTATRIGLAAARQYILPVLTTRAGLQCGQYYQFDDMWWDVDVNFEGQSKGLRPLEFCAYDVYSGSKIAWGIRPRLLNDATGKHDQLKDKEMRFLAAHILCDVGYHRDGCTWIVEHGTAAVKASMEERIKRFAGNIIQFQRSAILDEQVHAGMWPGKKMGNFRIKALTETMMALHHTIAAALPGQVGKDRDHYPERMRGLSAYNESLIKALERLQPERARLLVSPLLHFDVLVSIASELYERMDWRTWHALEGWEKEGLVVSEFRLGDDSNWFPMDNLQEMQQDQRTAITAFLKSKPEYMRTRKLAPREVWNRGKSELTRLSKFLIPEILGPDDGASLRVQDNGTIVFEDRYLGPGKHIYYATVTTPDGFLQTLCKGREYLAHVTPYHAEEMFISDKESGALIGIAPRYDRAVRYDLDALHTLMGKQAHDQKLLSEPIRERHQAEVDSRAALIAHNTAVLSGKPVTVAERAAQARIKAAEGNLEDVVGTRKEVAAEVEDEAEKVLSEAVQNLDKIF
jgi:hypothetical protein